MCENVTGRKEREGGVVDATPVGGRSRKYDGYLGTLLRKIFRAASLWVEGLLGGRTTANDEWREGGDPRALFRN